MKASLATSTLLILALSCYNTQADEFNNFEICGKPKDMTRMNRIVNGVDADKGDLPWQAAVRPVNSNGMPFCGATLISKQWAISAAHCGVRAGQELVFGANNMGLSSEGKSFLYRNRLSYQRNS